MDTLTLLSYDQEDFLLQYGKEFLDCFRYPLVALTEEAQKQLTLDHTLVCCYIHSKHIPIKYFFEQILVESKRESSRLDKDHVIAFVSGAARTQLYELVERYTQRPAERTIQMITHYPYDGRISFDNVDVTQTSLLYKLEFVFRANGLYPVLNRLNPQELLVLERAKTRDRIVVNN